MRETDNIRAACLALHRVYADVLNGSADLAEYLPPEHVAGAPFLALLAELDRMRAPLRALADHCCPANARPELYKALLAGFSGMPNGDSQP